MRITFFVVLAAGLSAATFTGPVKNVHDGDTFTVQIPGQEMQIRLWAVDCPELSQSGGTAAMRAARRLIGQQPVTIRTRGRSYQRVVASVELQNGKSLGMELVRGGFCWVEPRYNTSVELSDLEKAAREKRIGIWAELDPTPPWVWRKTRHARVAK